MLLGVALALVAAFLATLIARSDFRRERRGAKRPDAVVAAVDPLLATPEGSAEELAARGRFREAVHALLVDGLKAVGWLPDGAGKSATAREIVHGLDESDVRADPLERLLARTELVWFGGRDASIETYRAARAEYEAILAGSAPERTE